MPPALALLSTLANRNLDTATNISIPSLAANSTIHDGGLHVICAWPVSGQYGPGSRALYYALVAACVFARKADWLRGACLAGALIIPAVAALHGIVLAIMHIPGAVDMDIYGAFQACCIGILAAPITVKLSKTYFNNPGRNTIFLWTILLLAGLLSLTVEFYRVSPTTCNLLDEDGNPILDPKHFPYQDGDLCGLTCSVQNGPYNRMRIDAVNNIYVIPVPGTPLTTGTATLIAAACCIPAILLLVSMWNTILENNWRARFGRNDEDRLDDIIEGTNAATLRKMRVVNKRIGSFLGIVEALVFGGAVVTILIIGEINFFSDQTKYQTEPIQSIGQWGPLVGAAIAALGSLYVWSMSDSETDKGDSPSPDNGQHCSCTHHHHDGSMPSSRGSGETHGVLDGVFESPMHDQTPFPDLEQARSPPQMEEIRKRSTLPPSTYSTHAHGTKERATSFSSERGRSPPRSPTGDEKPQKQNTGGRLKIAGGLEWLSEKFGTAEKGLFDDSDFRSGKASYYPSVPGEQFRNPDLHETEERYQTTRDLEETERRSRSRAPSIASGIDDDGTSRSRAVSPSPSVSRPRRSSTLNYHSSGQRGSTGSPTFPRVPERSSTLTVPGQMPHCGHTRQRSSLGSGALFITVPEADITDQSPINPISPVTPAIVVSADPETIPGVGELADSPVTAGPSNPTSPHSPA